MRKQSITVEYPALIKWLRTLSQWVEAAKKSNPKTATFDVWKNDRYTIADWVENGHCIMVMGQCDAEVAQELMNWIDAGVINPELVTEQLDYQNWDYVVSDDDSEEETDYFPLKDSWDAAIGFAMVLSKRELPFCDKSRAWLAQGLDLFYVTHEVEEGYTLIELVDESHEEWLHELCKKSAWAREVTAAWTLDNGDNSPSWPWCFDDTLGQVPSADFLDNVLFEIEQTLSGNTNPQVGLLKAQAPNFFHALDNGRTVYAALYGSLPQEDLAQKMYCANRAEALRSMLAQAIEPYAENVLWPGGSSSSPSMGRLFAEDAPSNAP